MALTKTDKAAQLAALLVRPDEDPFSVAIGGFYRRWFNLVDDLQPMLATVAKLKGTEDEDWVPAWCAVAASYENEAEAALKRGDRASARLAWTDGIAVVSIFEFEAGAPGGRWAIEELPRPEAGKVVVERRSQEGTSFLRGRVADTGFVVIGSLGEAELTELISSLEFESVDKEVGR